MPVIKFPNIKAPPAGRASAPEPSEKTAMDNKKYEAIVKIAETGNLTKTAEQMGYTQSAVTQMVKSLENELGIQLLVRTNKGVTLTKSAAQLLPFMIEEQRWEKRIQEECSRMLGLDTGLVTVGCLSSLSSAWMPEILETFSRKHPAVQVRMEEHESPLLENLLLSGRIDLAIMELTENTRCRPISLHKDEIVAVVPDNHPLSGKDTVSLHELQEYPLISYSTGGTGAQDPGWPDLIIGLITGQRTTWQVRYSCKDDLTALRMVSCGLGVTLSGRIMLENHRTENRVIPLDPPLFRDLGIALRKREEPAPAVREFIDCVLEHR